MSPKPTLEVPPPLSAKDKSSFAYKTIKDRLPVIVVKTIDFFHRQRKELHRFGGTISVPNETELAEIEQDAKELISYLCKLRKEVETNKTLELFERLTLDPEFEYFNDDIEAWNQALEANRLTDKSMPRWFESPWLLVECYLYRKIKEGNLRSKHLKMFDPFVEQKQAACKASLPQMTTIVHSLSQIEKALIEPNQNSHSSERTEFGLFLQLALWANKSDLSISGMSADKIRSEKLSANLKDSIEDMQENILCDNMSEVWFKVQSIKSQVQAKLDSVKVDSGDNPIYIDLVADNSGYEVFVDLCLIHFLGLMFCGSQQESDNMPVRFRIHLKRMPWFVSDCVRQDFDWLIDYLTANDQDATLQAIGQKWKSFVESKFWEIHDHKFWTLPYDYSEMKSVAGDLYGSLSKASLIIFKGDLNYRKLSGDRKWHMLTPFRAALREFSPAPLVALRTAKADVVVGIEDVNIYARINNNELPRDWMISGDYGLIQYMDPL